MTPQSPYKGRRWILAARRTALRPVVDWGLAQPTANRAMLPPTFGSLLCTLACLAILRWAATGLVDPVLGVGATVVVLWPMALGMALATDLMRKEHILQRRLAETGGRAAG